jgi:hypothetical protein
MLSQCVNPQCGKPFLKLREGKLFLVQTEFAGKSADEAAALYGARKQPRRVGYYWMCSDCAGKWTLIDDREQGSGWDRCFARQRALLGS